jgi:hypothetical protein
MLSINSFIPFSYSNIHSHYFIQYTHHILFRISISTSSFLQSLNQSILCHLFDQSILPSICLSTHQFLSPFTLIRQIQYYFSHRPAPLRHPHKLEIVLKRIRNYGYSSHRFSVLNGSQNQTRAEEMSRHSEVQRRNRVRSGTDMAVRKC